MNQQKKILVVDDDANFRLTLRATLQQAGYEIYEAEDGRDAVELAGETLFDLILLDLRMKDMQGDEALRRIKSLSPAVPVVIMTAFATVQTAVETLKQNAFDYLIKPVDMNVLLAIVEKAMHYYEMERENKVLKERIGEQFDFSRIIGRSKKMRQAMEILSLAAPSHATILILGESGTGKELIANAIHQNSGRREQAFVKINCAALAENLLESELFGHERGAFTGAIQQRKGRFEMADSGTIFLDEIGDMAPSTQAKILRVLQEGEFERLGSSKTMKVDVRIIAATHRNLEEAITKNTFREDLYFRLSVVTLELPPLRERQEDIPALAEHFLHKYAEKNQRLMKGFAPKTMDILLRYSWPGNIRELENTIERAVILCREEFVQPECLPKQFQELLGLKNEGETGVRIGHSIREVEKELILKTLDQTDGNRTHAAEILGITRRALQYKLKEYGL
ncbi:MAG: sigma-54-dependent Fis family transcriptional regulator [Calditrichaeota bacterium]|nr:MAG: sigma-54-dependent Fis family transcriptional regulator [Calditrichota bacterium]